MNTITITGRLTADPEDEAFDNAQGEHASVANFRVADNRPGKDAGANFHAVKAYGPLGVTVMDYLKKGRLVRVDGSLKQDQWTDDQDRRHERWTVIASNVEFLDRPATDET